jgi:hypothetical protein
MIHGKQKHWDKNPFQCCFVQHKSHADRHTELNLGLHGEKPVSNSLSSPGNVKCDQKYTRIMAEK